MHAGKFQVAQLRKNLQGSVISIFDQAGNNFNADLIKSFFGFFDKHCADALFSVFR